MNFLHRAAIIAAVTFCVGTLANAATPNAKALEDVSLQQSKPLEHHVVPVFPSVAEALPQAEAQPEQGVPEFETLSAAVAAQDASSADGELRCLAVGVYYESKGEPLAGQLAVADVILNRTTSGRFPRTVCSVLTQRGQFSFVRGGKLPSPPENAAWRKALAVAQVAQKDLWDSPVENALYFHARYVSPGWKRARVGMIGNHIFYR